MKPDRFALLARPAASAAVCAALVGATLLSGCASAPESRFYTLGAGTDAAPPTANEAIKPALLIEVPTVQMPTQVARNQLVVQDDATRVTVLEQERWASPPADEVRRALSGDLAARLGTFDVFGSPHPENVPVYRIAVNVRRFESWLGSRAVLDTVWSVRSLRTQAMVTCSTVQTETVGQLICLSQPGHHGDQEGVDRELQQQRSRCRPAAHHSAADRVQQRRHLLDRCRLAGQHRNQLTGFGRPAGPGHRRLDVVRPSGVQICLQLQ